MSETNDTITDDSGACPSTPPGSETAAGQENRVATVDKPGLAKAKPEHHQRTLDRWNRKAQLDFKFSPYHDILCHMVEKRIPFVGGRIYGLPLDPVSTDKVAEYLVGNNMTIPAEVAMVLFQTFHFSRISPNQVRSICRMIEEQRGASVPGLLRQIASLPNDLGTGTLSNRMAKRVDRLIPGVINLEKHRKRR